MWLGLLLPIGRFSRCLPTGFHVTLQQMDNLETGMAIPLHAKLRKAEALAHGHRMTWQLLWYGRPDLLSSSLDACDYGTVCSVFFL